LRDGQGDGSDRTMVSSVMLALLSVATATASDFRSLAGEYYEGDGLGVNWTLVLRAEGTFAFTWDGCMGRYAESHGVARLTNGILELTPEKAAQGALEKRVPLHWLPAVWADRVYLLERDAIPLFAKYVNLGWEPRSEMFGMFLLRRDDWKTSVTGLPDLPKDSLRLLLAEPIEAHVVRRFSGRRAELNAGAAQHVWPGMLLTAVEAKGEWIDVKVISVELDHSVVEAEEGHVLKKQQRVTSRP
jgi:hypothetical protein